MDISREILPFTILRLRYEMATKWEKVKYIRRVRPDSDDGLTDECYDAIDDSKVNITLNGEQSALTSQEGIKPKFYQENPLLSQSQPILKHRSNSCLYLSVPQNIGRQKIHEEARGTSSLRKTSSTFSLVNSHEIDGDISTRSQPSKNTPRILVRDLFNSKPQYKSHRLKVSLNIIYINKLLYAAKSRFSTFLCFIIYANFPIVIKVRDIVLNEVDIPELAVGKRSSFVNIE